MSSKSEGRRLKRRIRELEDALRPFARFTHERDLLKRDDVFVPADGPVWFYIGHFEGQDRCHLHTDDFEEARKMLA